MLREYRNLLGINALTKITSFFVSYTTIFVLNRILVKDTYGELMFFTSIFGYLSILGSLGFDKLLIFRLSKYTRVAGEAYGGELLLRLGLRAALCTAVFELIFVLGWWLLQPPGYELDRFFVVVLAVSTLLNSPLVLGSAYLESNKRPTAAVSAGLFFLVFRFTVLLAIYKAQTGSVGLLALYFVLPALLHLFWFVWYFRRLPQGRAELQLTGQDYRYALDMMLTKFFHIGVETLGLLLVGIMLSSAQVAEFAVGVKIALLVTMGNELLAPLAGPRLKYQMDAGDTLQVYREYHFLRRFALYSALGVLLLIVLFGKPVLGLIGDYGQSYPILCILALAYFNKLAFGPNGRYLALRGHARAVMVLSMMTLFVMIITAVVGIAAYGLAGAAWSTLVCLLISNVACQVLIERLDGILFLSRGHYAGLAAVNLLFAGIIVATG